MRKLLKGSLLTLGATMLAMPAMAGYSQPVIVYVDLDNNFAQGDMIAARTSKNDEVYIGCGTRNIETSPGGPLFSWAFCQALDTDGDQVTCFTQNPDLVKTINAINDSSYVTFNWTDDGAGNLTCTSMGFSTQSFYLDKHTAGNSKGNENK